MSIAQIQDTITKLAKRRPIFHSEADFQHALAWELQLDIRPAQIRLEKQVSEEKSPAYLDLLVSTPNQDIAIELKYKTRASRFVHEDEEFNLKNQSAQDIGRYDFIKDIQRLEKYVHTNKKSEGFAIILTNDRTYWSESRKADAVDSDFRIHDGRILHGKMNWGDAASKGTTHNRTDPINLRGEYTLSWQEYSTFGKSHEETFRYALLHVQSAI